MSDIEYVTKAAVMMIIEQQGAKIKQLEQENAKLKEQLKEAESVIEFYSHYDDVFGSHNFDISCEACTEKPLGKRARQYLAKYKTNE